MPGLHPQSGISEVVYVLILEALFLAAAISVIGLGLQEIRKKRNYPKNLTLVVFGFSIAAISLYVTRILLSG